MKLDTYHRLLWLYDHPNVTAAMMSKKFGVNAKSVRSWAARLFGDNVLEKRAAGRATLWRVRDDVRL